MKKHALKAESREVTGRKVKKLRAEGKLPATIYGKNFKSQSLTLDAESFSQLLNQAGTSGLIDLTVGTIVYPVIIGAIQYDPVSNHPIHAEMRKVDLKEKIKTNVPVKLSGESAVVASGEGILLQAIQEVEIEALPTDLPEHLDVDISLLKAVNDEITVGKLVLPKGVDIVTDPNQPVVRVTPPVKEEVLPEPTETPAVGETVPGAEAGPTEPGEPAAEDKS